MADESLYICQYYYDTAVVYMIKITVKKIYRKQ